jgi:hypothetical protein
LLRLFCSHTKNEIDERDLLTKRYKDKAAYEIARELSGEVVIIDNNKGEEITIMFVSVTNL